MSQISDLVASRVRDVPDFPKPGIVFKDLSPLLADGVAFGALVDDIARRWEGQIDIVAGVEARGFIFGAPVAHALGLGFVPIRKAGKLPGDTIASAYSLEYGTAEVEVQADAFPAGARVLLIDDVLATGGTAAAACELIERSGATTTALEFLIELAFLEGRSRITSGAVNAILTV
ncbi:adenine phosphoribosyltransferase [Terrabacter sp. LjRoot27]|uniref:adenine phosphoribosyltransferase n=1 Tax=Terrabacter sp. LjRoot27 TaxID=3342306 RepID=UPI003ECDEA19